MIKKQTYSVEELTLKYLTFLLKKGIPSLTIKVKSNKFTYLFLRLHKIKSPRVKSTGIRCVRNLIKSKVSVFPVNPERLSKMRNRVVKIKYNRTNKGMFNLMHNLMHFTRMEQIRAPFKKNYKLNIILF